MAVAINKDVRRDGSVETPVMGEGCELPINFEIGARTHCEDGPCGKLVRLVMDPATDGVTDIVVERGVLQKHDRVVPIGAIQRMEGGEIHLGVHSSRLADYPEYREVEFRVPTVGWSSSKHRPDDVRYWMTSYHDANVKGVVPASRQRVKEGVAFGSELIGRGTKVHCIRGGAGEVDHVLVDCAEGQITHLVVKRSLRNEYHIIPVGLILDVGDGGVTLSATREEVLALPLYNPRS